MANNISAFFIDGITLGVQTKSSKYNFLSIKQIDMIIKVEIQVSLDAAYGLLVL